ncbi:MAG: DUF4123 domain-containing protein [Rhodobacteraceae bacterium]|nr:DUF4123 domain-containing protein [Paracoccaceae bacterium]
MRRKIDAVRPLDAQFHAAPKLCVPEPLAALLFPGAPFTTYAILDAAKVANLPEMIGTSGLPHRCLFSGAAEETLGAVAPWVVGLAADNAFTRCLFSRSDAPWHLWDAAPGIFVVSQADLDSVWSHFRKFTRVQDEAGRWFYFRFWDPAVWDGILDGDEGFAARLLGPHQVVFRSRATADGATFKAAGAAT